MATDDFNPTSKTCSNCGEQKDRGSFYKAPLCKDGLRGECKACIAQKRKAYCIKNAEKIAAQKLMAYKAADPSARSAKNAAYYQDNAERIKQKTRDWHAVHGADAAVRKRAYWQKNRDALLVKKQQYKLENATDIQARARAWYAENKERLRPDRKIRKANRRSAGKLSRLLVGRLMEMQRSKCACCRVSLSHGYHLDHITPLARGGKNEDHNMQLLCPTCNLTKSAKDPIDFMQSRGFLL